MATAILLAPSSIDCSTLWTLNRGLLMHLACQLSTIPIEEKGPVARESSGPIERTLARGAETNFSTGARRRDVVDRLFERVDGAIHIVVCDDQRRSDFDARADRAHDHAEIKHAARDSPHRIVFEHGFCLFVRGEVDGVPASHASNLPNDRVIADRRFETRLQILAVFEGFGVSFSRVLMSITALAAAAATAWPLNV
jgi:hypothetical protein